jgi:chromate reductase
MSQEKKNMSKMRIAVFVGSLRKESFSGRMAKAMIALAPPALSLELVEIGHLAHYNQDLEEAPPAPWLEFRKRLADFVGFLFVTPEYNRSVPGVLKNALDVGSRPYGKSVWSGKPGAVVSVSPGGLSGFGANPAADNPRSDWLPIAPVWPQLGAGQVERRYGRPSRSTPRRAFAC